MATNRPGGAGGIDIWVAHRSSTDVGFGAPVNLGPEINGGADDFCPTPVRGGFVLREPRDGRCAPGNADMYFARLHPPKGWTTPSHLGCTLNSAGDEFSPSYLSRAAAACSISRATAAATTTSTAALSRPTAASPRRSRSKDQHGVERVPTERPQGRARDRLRLGPPGRSGRNRHLRRDRSSVDDSWSAPANLGSAINTPAGESRASLSWDGRTLIFGSAKPGGEGSSDIYFSTR